MARLDNLGCLLEKGRCVPQNPKEAAKWHRKAAKQGVAPAQFSLGYMYETGRGVPRSDARALAWYRKAARGGEPKAQCNLGVMYDTGRPQPREKKGKGRPAVQPNAALAASFYRAAAEQGLANAQVSKPLCAQQGNSGGQTDR